MANATFTYGGHTYMLPFEPSSISWGYSINTSGPTDTYDGVVVQILGCKIDTLSLSGSLSYDIKRDDNDEIIPDFRFSQLDSFEKHIKEMMEYQQWKGQGKPTSPPITLEIPGMANYINTDNALWNNTTQYKKFKVFLDSYPDVSRGFDTKLTYKLTMTVVEGGEDLVEISRDDAAHKLEIQALDAIKSGVQWVWNRGYKFNMSPTDPDSSKNYQPHNTTVQASGPVTNPHTLVNCHQIGWNVNISQQGTIIIGDK